MKLFKLVNQFAKLAYEEAAPDTVLDFEFDPEPETEKIPSLAEFFDDEESPDTLRQETVIEAMANNFIKKYADELTPDTIKIDESVLAPTVPLDGEDDLSNIPVPKLDGTERSIHNLTPQKQKMLSALDLMFHAGIVTPVYYQQMRKYIYGEGDMTVIFGDMVAVVQDAEKEMRLYQKRLSNVKELLSN